MSEQKVGPPPLWQKETRTKLVEIINQEDEIVYQRDEMAATPQGFYEESDLDLAVDSVNALHAAGLTPEQVRTIYGLQFAAERAEEVLSDSVRDEVPPEDDECITVRDLLRAALADLRKQA